MEDPMSNLIHYEAYPTTPGNIVIPGKICRPPNAFFNDLRAENRKKLAKLNPQMVMVLHLIFLPFYRSLN
jgi:hypothetical protein